MNFVFISPHFPANVWQYCRALKENGVNVLGVADAPWEELSPELQASLSDYYRVGSLENRDEMVRALGWFTYKYGKIDWLESNNEYWLEQDAWLRRAFYITSGPQPERMRRDRRKSSMKDAYARAGIATAPYALPENVDQALAFAARVGYPLVVKPDSGVGAQGTYRLNDEEQLRHFFANLPPLPYIMEPYVFGEICSYDAIVDSRGEPLFESGNITRGSIMDFVNERQDCVFYIPPRPADDLVDAGRRCLKAWDVRSRSIHFEFFRLSRDQEGLGKSGDLVGLEVNLRPSGGLSADMINYAGSVDVYRMWADMICHDRVFLNDQRQRYYCVFVGRRDWKHYLYPHHQLLHDWASRIVMQERTPRALADTMGEQAYLLRCGSQEEMDAFLNYALKTTE